MSNFPAGLCVALEGKKLEPLSVSVSLYVQT